MPPTGSCPAARYTPTRDTVQQPVVLGMLSDPDASSRDVLRFRESRSLERLPTDWTRLRDIDRVLRASIIAL